MEGIWGIHDVSFTIGYDANGNPERIPSIMENKQCKQKVCVCLHVGEDVKFHY